MHSSVNRIRFFISGSFSSLFIMTVQASTWAAKYSLFSIWTIGILYGLNSNSFLRILLTDSRAIPLIFEMDRTDVCGVSVITASTVAIFPVESPLFGRPMKEAGKAT